jgi:tetratricopeptide (TPR) repeat protein
LDRRQQAKEAFGIFDQHLGDGASATLTALNSVAMAHTALRHWDEAQRCYEDVIERRQQIKIKQPDNYANITGLGGAQCNLGNLFAKQKKYEQAVPWYRNAIVSLEVAVQSSSLATARLYLGYSHWGCGEALRRLGQHTASLAELSEASSLVRSDDDKVSIEIAKSITMAANGRFETAVSQLEPLLSSGVPEPEHWYDAARVYAISIASIRDNETLTEAEQDQVQEYTDQAMKLLTKALEDGYFHHPRDVALLETEDDFAALSENDDFMSILHRLKADTTKRSGTE